MEETQHPGDWHEPSDCNILGCFLKNTCGACPEQYDVFKDGDQIGYLRLRWGYFRADYPDCGGEEVYNYTTDETGWHGQFENPAQRKQELKNAVESLLKKHADV